MIESSIIKKILIILFLLTLNGCVQNSAFLGPLYTLGTTGNALQAGASYGTSYVVKRMTGMTKSENIKKALKDKKINDDIFENPEKFFRVVKKHVKELNKLDNPNNQ